MEFRSFFKKPNFQPAATASAYIEVAPTESSTHSTKLSCQIFGPMQKQTDFGLGASHSGESCTLKVGIDFADTLQADSLILE